MGYLFSSLFSWQSCCLRFDPWGVKCRDSQQYYHAKRTVMYDLRSIDIL